MATIIPNVPPSLTDQDVAGFFSVTATNENERVPENTAYVMSASSSTTPDEPTTAGQVTNEHVRRHLEELRRPDRDEEERPRVIWNGEHLHVGVSGVQEGISEKRFKNAKEANDYFLKLLDKFKEPEDVPSYKRYFHSGDTQPSISPFLGIYE